MLNICFHLSLGGIFSCLTLSYLLGKFSFGPGQMRVWARTARPIGGVQVAAPVVTRELALEKEPIKLDIGATIVDDKNLDSRIEVYIRDTLKERDLWNKK